MLLGTGYITTAGAELLADVIEGGDTLEWTKCTLTSQRLDNMTAAELKALTTITQNKNGTVDTAISSETDNKINLSCRIDNQNLSNGMYCYGFGIWARKEGGTEVLVYVAPKAGTVCYLNIKSYGLTRIYIEVALQVEDAAITQITVNQSGGMATQDALDDEIEARESLESVTVKTNTAQTISGQKTITASLYSSNIYPNSTTTEGTYSVGSAGRPYQFIYVNNLSTSSISYPLIFQRNAEPSTTDSLNLGSSSKKWKTGYFKVVSTTTMSATTMSADKINPTGSNREIGNIDQRWTSAEIQTVNAVDVLPSEINNNNTNLGTDERPWSNIHAGNLYLSNDANIEGDITTEEINAEDITTGNLNTGDITITGTMLFVPGATLTAPRGTIDAYNIEASTLTAVNAETTGTLTANRIEANGITTNTLSATSTTTGGLVSGNIRPMATDDYTIGTSSEYWGNLYCGAISCNGITPRSSGSYDLGSSSKYWRNFYCGTINCTSITPRATNSYTLGSDTYKFNNLYANSLSGSINAIIRAIAPTSQIPAVGQIGLFAYTKNVTSTTPTFEHAGSSVPGSSLQFANICKKNSDTVNFDRNSIMSGTYKIMNTVYWFTSTTGEQTSLVLAIRTA